MSDSWSVNPSRVRGLGDIVSPKQLSSFDVWNTVLSSGSATIGDEVLTVYTGEYKVSCNFTDLSFLPLYSLEEDTATVSCKLKYTGSVVYGATVKCIVNDTVTYTGVTDNNGSVSFSIDLTLDDVLFYGVKLVFEGNSNVGGCFHNLHFWHGNVTGLSLVSDANTVGVDDDAHLLATLTGLNNQEVPVGVAGQTVNFYEEYTPGVRLKLPEVLMAGDEISITGELFDTVDGSRVCLAGETINVYEEYTPGIRLKLPKVIQSGDEISITAQLIDTSDGSRVCLAGETVEIYEEVDLTGITLSVNKDVLSYADGDHTTLICTISGDDVEGRDVVFKANGEVLSTRQTSSRGVAYYVYNAQGVGDVEFTAECGSLVSETYEVQDCFIYDTTGFSYTSTSTNDTTYPTGWDYGLPSTENFEMEFDYNNPTGFRLYFAGMKVTSIGDNITYGIGFTRDSSGKLTFTVRDTSTQNTTCQSINSGTNHYRVVFNGNTVNVWVNDVQQVSNRSISWWSSHFPYYFNWAIWAKGTGNVTNIKIKPL